ncbi:hypothetical protein CBS101457_001696 [Exobasidium rhododendri]|nr:hypothetical protein CBS101457_001696 [Exobasidium rhododendri]
MVANGLILPIGTLPPLRGDLQKENGQEVPTIPMPCTSGSSALNQILSPSPSATGSREIVIHDEHIANVTQYAYSELAKLSQVAAIAEASAATSQSSHQKRRSSHSSSNTPTMFIKPSPKGKRPAKGLELRALLDRNRNLLKSREVCRLLSAGQIEKLKKDTLELEKSAQAAKDTSEIQEMEDMMLELATAGDEDGDTQKETPQRLNLRSTQRGKTKLISVKENAKLQRANYEAERKMERTREYELMGRQMSKLNLAKSRHIGRSELHNAGVMEEDNVDVLGLGHGLQDADETGQEADGVW